MEDQRQVKTEDGNQLSEDLEMDYFVESSAKSGLNAEKIFVKQLNYCLRNMNY